MAAEVAATQSQLSAQVAEALSGKDASVRRVKEAMERSLMRVEELELFRLEEQVGQGHARRRRRVCRQRSDSSAHDTHTKACV